MKVSIEFDESDFFNIIDKVDMSLPAAEASDVVEMLGKILSILNFSQPVIALLLLLDVFEDQSILASPSFCDMESDIERLCEWARKCVNRSNKMFGESLDSAGDSCTP